MNLLPSFPHFKIALLFLNFGIISIQAQTQKTIIPVGFYNLENLFDTENDTSVNDEDFLPTGPYNYTDEVYHEKLDNLSKVISELGMDKNPDGVICLGVSEIENRKVLIDLVNQPALKNREYKIVHFNSHDARGVDVGLLYQPKYFKLISAKPLYLFLDRKEYKTRSVLWVTGEIQKDTFHFFVNHWPSRRGGASATAYLRDSAAAISANVIDSFLNLNPNSKCMVLGDLNDNPEDESLTKILHAKENIKELKKVNDKFNPFYALYKKGFGTTAYQDAWSLFDQIILTQGLVNNEIGFKYWYAHIYNPSYLTQKFGHFKGYPLRSFSNNQWIKGFSDHFPVVVYLKN